MKELVISRKWMTIIGLIGFGLILLVLGIYAVTSAFAWYIKILGGIGIAGALAFWVLSAISSRVTRYGLYVAVMMLLALSILVLVNFFSARHLKGRTDTTTGKQFSLSEQTEKVLKGLTQDINIIAFYSEDHYRRRIAIDTLNEYEQKSNKIHVTFIDPRSKPGLASTYKNKQDKIEMFNGVAVFELGDKTEYVQSYENEEQDFTSAILKLPSTAQKKVYFLDGHGERDIDGYEDDSYGNLKKMIEAENYVVEKLVLARLSAVPDDCDILVIAGPQKPLLTQEEEAISEYLDGGGKAVILVDPAPHPSLTNILKEWNVEVHNDIILDGFGQSLFGDPSVPVVIQYGYHPITVPLARMMTFFPVARSVASRAKSQNLEVIELVKTSNNSWGETNLQVLQPGQRIMYNEGQDIKGPLSVAVAVTLKGKKVSTSAPDKLPVEKAKERRLLVAVGDSDFATNRCLDQGNPDLFMNSLNWLTEEEELISIRPKGQEQQAQVQKLTGRELRFVRYSSIFGVPIILLIIGGWVWWKRR